MSGNFGWDGGNSGGGNSYKDYDYEPAYKPYRAPRNEPVVIKQGPGGNSLSIPLPQQPKKKPAPIPPFQPKQSAYIPKSTATPKQVDAFPIPTATHNLTATADSVLLISLDLTGSAKEWMAEILERMPTLFFEAQKYLGTNLQILFTGHGDIVCDCRDGGEPIQVSPCFGSDQILEDHIHALNTKGIFGGGNGAESPEMLALYFDEKLDLAKAKNVYTMFITDEPGRNVIKSTDSKKYLDVNMPNDLDTKDIFSSLNRKSHVFGIICDTETAQKYNTQAWWKGMLGDENVCSLADKRRVVDLILNIIAKMTDQEELFDEDMRNRQGQTQYTNVNIATVKNSVALVGSKLKIPKC